MALASWARFAGLFCHPPSVHFSPDLCRFHVPRNTAPAPFTRNISPPPPSPPAPPSPSHRAFLPSRALATPLTPPPYGPHSSRPLSPGILGIFGWRVVTQITHSLIFATPLNPGLSSLNLDLVATSHKRSFFSIRVPGQHILPTPLLPQHPLSKLLQQRLILIPPTERGYWTFFFPYTNPVNSSRCHLLFVHLGCDRQLLSLFPEPDTRVGATGWRKHYRATVISSQQAPSSRIRSFDERVFQRNHHHRNKSSALSRTKSSALHNLTETNNQDICGSRYYLPCSPATGNPPFSLYFILDSRFDNVPGPTQTPWLSGKPSLASSSILPPSFSSPSSHSTPLSSNLSLSSKRHTTMVE